MTNLFKKFVSLDSYAAPINGNFQGANTHGSALGATVTILTYLLIALIALDSGSEMVLLESPTIKTYIQYGNKDVQNHEKEYFFRDNSLDLFFAWVFYDES